MDVENPDAAIGLARSPARGPARVERRPLARKNRDTSDTGEVAAVKPTGASRGLARAAAANAAAPPASSAAAPDAIDVRSEKELVGEMHAVRDTIRSLDAPWKKRMDAMDRLEGIAEGNASADFSKVYSTCARELADALTEQVRSRGRREGRIRGVCRGCIGWWCVCVCVFRGNGGLTYG